MHLSLESCQHYSTRSNQFNQFARCNLHTPSRRDTQDNTISCFPRSLSETQKIVLNIRNFSICAGSSDTIPELALAIHHRATSKIRRDIVIDPLAHMLEHTRYLRRVCPQEAVASKSPAHCGTFFRKRASNTPRKTDFLLAIFTSA